MEHDHDDTPKRSRVHKTAWTKVCNLPGHYLLLAGSNSAWAGFASEEEARACLLVLPGWRYHHHI